MLPIFTYLIQVNIALGLFYLLYVVALKGDTFFRLRRFFFLSAIVFSLVYPFWTISSLGDLWGAAIMSRNGAAVVLPGEPGMAVMADEGSSFMDMFSWTRMFSWGYWLITVVFVFRFLVQLLSILRLNGRCEKRYLYGAPVFLLKQDAMPFSFFSRIFIHAEGYSETELVQILLHEQAHARQWHSVDIMVIEIVSLFSWWNPFVWLMKREMVMNLEYLADKGVLREGVDSRDYQYHLLRLTYPETAVQIVNNFNVSQLKQRIMMMNKSKSPASKVAKYLLLLPLAFLLIFANSCMNRDKKSEAPEPAVTEIPAPDESEMETGDEADVLEVVENQPVFPGGLQGLQKFLSDNTNYPEEAQKNGIEGRVIVRFIVDKDGSVRKAQVLRGVDPLLDKEAVRVVNAMPKWEPGTQKGEAVGVYFTLPVVFKLEGNNSNKTSDASTAAKPGASNDVFEVVENAPEFPGGVDALNKWLNENINYPAIAQGYGIQGRVIVRFIVEKDGRLSNMTVLRGVDPSLDKEAVRVVKAMPKWKPGTQRGEAVRVYYTLPIVFRLQK